ncbi:MAG: 3-dehydroquinate synthase [Candidatus Brocadiia bacterium]
MENEISVELPNQSYPIRFSAEGLDGVGAFLQKLSSPTKCGVITDDNVAPVYADAVASALRETGLDLTLLTIPPGEEQKNIAVFGNLCEQLVEDGLDRQSIIVALGGGVVGDIAGFVAASFMRGIPCLQIPTTMLAQVDSSVGGKTAVNLPQGKNLVGAFHQPIGVYIDSSVLETLPKRELRAGLVEVIKYGVIWDAEFFEWLETNLEALLELVPQAVVHAVHRSCEIKAQVVGQDERETGIRAILNYGHTAGHAIEALSAYGEYRHGEAVAIGMAVAADLSENKSGFPEEHTRRQNALLERLSVPTEIAGLTADELMQRMKWDKKVVGSTVRFILARELGEVEVRNDVSDDELRDSLKACGAD